MRPRRSRPILGGDDNGSEKAASQYRLEELFTLAEHHLSETRDILIRAQGRAGEAGASSVVVDIARLTDYVCEIERKVGALRELAEQR